MKLQKKYWQIKRKYSNRENYVSITIRKRTGAATGIIMTAFSIAAVAGVPAGIVLGAYINWSATFYLLVALSLIIWITGYWLVPSLAQHLVKKPTPLKQIIPNLFAMISDPRNLNAYALTFFMMISHMLVIPFISPMLVANHGIAPQQIAWIYMAGGAATFFTSRRVGILADRFGKHCVFRCVTIISLIPVLLITHLPNLPLLAMIAFFPVFMVFVSGRMIPMQALITTVPHNDQRGAFLSVNSAIQSLGNGCGAWLGGLLLSISASGEIIGYGTNGWLAGGILIVAILWIGRVHAQPVITV